MILILTPNIDPESNSYQQLMSHLSRLQDIKLRVHREQGTQQTLTEIYLIGNTSAIAVDDMSCHSRKRTPTRPAGISAGMGRVAASESRIAAPAT